MLSYAQNAEDVVLARVLDGRPPGFYVDVGADDPELNSVTKHFYDRGWSGVNVAPSRTGHGRIGAARPRDVTLLLALSDGSGRDPGTQRTADGSDGAGGLCGSAPDTRETGTDRGGAEIEVTTLADMCARHVVGSIEFMRIAAGGHEARVIRGGDWRRFRPRVVVVAWTSSAGASIHASPETRLTAAGYQFALFDGLNRFYVRAEDADLLPRLAAPANAGDDWAPHGYVHRLTEMENDVAQLRTRVAEAEEAAASFQQRTHALEELWATAQRLAAERERYALDVRDHFERCEAWARTLQAKVRRFETHLGLLPDTLPPSPTDSSPDAFVRFLYEALRNRPNPAPAEITRWVDRLRAGATMLELFEAFLAAPEGHEAFWSNPFFRRYLHADSRPRTGTPTTGRGA